MTPLPRHAELVSASMPHCGSKVSLYASLTRASVPEAWEAWTLKQVQGDDVAFEGALG
jgi:hypothetical protein